MLVISGNINQDFCKLYNTSCNKTQTAHSSIHRWIGQSLGIKSHGRLLQMNRTQLLRFLGLPGWCESLAEESPNVRSREVVDDSQVDQNTDSAEEVPESYLNYGVDDRQGENHDSHRPCPALSGKRAPAFS